MRDRNMSRHKKVERTQGTPNGKPPHPLIGFAARLDRAITAEEQLQGSWDIPPTRRRRNDQRGTPIRGKKCQEGYAPPIPPIL